MRCTYHKQISPLHVNLLYIYIYISWKQYTQLKYKQISKQRVTCKHTCDLSNWQKLTRILDQLLCFFSNDMILAWIILFIPIHPFVFLNIVLQKPNTCNIYEVFSSCVYMFILLYNTSFEKFIFISMLRHPIINSL